jgi:thiol-disulfide isomerase/thioredoxin
MKLRIILFLICICVISFGCSQESPKTPITQETIDFQIDPNRMTLATYKLVGETLPGTPKVVPARNSAHALFERLGISYDIKQIDKNTWVGPLMLGDSYVIGWIVEDKKLFGYCSEPFTATKDIEVTFSPGLPATVEYVVSPPPEDVNAFPAQFLLPIRTISDGNETYLSWGVNEIIEEPRTIKVEGLAAGTYRLSAITRQYEKYLNSRTPFLLDRREIEIKPESFNRYEVIYPDVDTTVEENDVTIRGALYDFDKKPLPNQIVNLIPYEDNLRDPLMDLYYPSCTTDPNGRFEFTGVRPYINATLNYEYTSILLLKESLTENASISVNLLLGMNTLPLVIGAPAQNLIIDFKDGSEGKLSEFIGKTVVVDFWATWSDACKKRVSELNKLAEKLSERSDVVFVELSIDYDRSKWEQAVDKSDWNQLRHGWLDLNKNIYALNQKIPCSMIIDKNGILRAAGLNLDIKLQLDKIIGNSK